MKKPDTNTRSSRQARRLLLEFAELSHMDQQCFIALMNDFLLTSPQQRRRLLAQWESALDSASDPVAAMPGSRPAG
ncbi:hypothetical protein AB4Z48_01300 [Cupriavidus sp. 2TAF22]|uniref:hypothetical protein n=1 Tax=unclassified Cupriavidus TaxID=2640874 RepID=UPI003F927EDC